MKDPRATLLLNEWHQALNDKGRAKVVGQAPGHRLGANIPAAMAEENLAGHTKRQPARHSVAAMLAHQKQRCVALAIHDIHRRRVGAG